MIPAGIMAAPCHRLLRPSTVAAPDGLHRTRPPTLSHAVLSQPSDDDRASGEVEVAEDVDRVLAQRGESCRRDPLERSEGDRPPGEAPGRHHPAPHEGDGTEDAVRGDDARVV